MAVNESAAKPTPPPPDTGGQLGERRLGTMAAVAQALAIGPMFSTALVLSAWCRTAGAAGDDRVAAR